MQILTFEELMQKRTEGLIESEKAILQKYDTYRALKRMVDEINTGPLDVVDYYATATRLGALLHEMAAGFTHTIFHYFADYIDPAQKGDVRCFRMECCELAQQMKELDRWRAKRHCLKSVK